MKRNKFFGLVLVLALLGMLSVTAYDAAGSESNQSAFVTAMVQTGNIVYAASCSQTDVQAAIDQAQEGDMVMVPAGECVWTQTVKVGRIVTWDPITYESKQITIQGAGIDKTVIVDEMPKTSTEPTLLSVITQEGKSFRLASFTFRGSLYNEGWYTTIGITGTSKEWRVDHCRFDHLYSRPFSISGFTYGVIDHCEYITHHWVQFIYVQHSGWGGHSYGDGSWNSPLSLGTEEAIFMEDNTFTWDDATDSIEPVDCSQGGRYVFRNNTLNNFPVGGNHGTESGGRHRSCFSYEVYNNNLTRLVTPSEWTLFFNRGGTGVLFDNTATGNYNSLSVCRVYRAFHSFAPWGACDGTSPYDVNDGVVYDSGTHTGGNGEAVLTAGGKSWTPNQWVGYSLHNLNQPKSGIITSNTENTISVYPDPYAEDLTWNTGDRFEILKAYPCIDQVGRSTGNLLSGNPPSPQEWPQQVLEPVYEWNNTINGNDADIISGSPLLIEGRDFVNDTPRPGYTPYTYPHPLTQDVLLTGTPLDRGIRLDWEVVTAFSFPNSTTWRITYVDPVGPPVVAASDLISPTQAYTLTDLTNGVPYTVTLNGMIPLPTAGQTPFYTATAIVTPTGPQLTLHGTPANAAIHLTWEVVPPPPPTITWRIDYTGQTTVTYPPISIVTPTVRAWTLTGLTNYVWYTVTLNAMLDSTPFLTDTVRVMPTDIAVCLPVVLKDH